MPGTTPILGLPYPEGTDPVREGDNVIKALAEAVEADLTAVIQGTPVPGSGWVIDDTGLFRAGNMVFLNLVTSKASWVAEGVMTLPEGFRPIGNTYFFGMGSSGVAPVSLICRYTGSVETIIAGSSGGILGCVCWVTQEPLP